MTWTPIAPGNIKSPLSPASIERIPSTGDLLLVWNNNYKPGRDGGKRTPYNLAISKDEGKTWIKTKSIESDPSGWYCYTAIDFVDDYVLLGHCAGNTRINNGLATTHITRLSLDWIYSEATADPMIESDSQGIVELSCKDQEAQIRYTLDGTLPSLHTGKVYQNLIEVTRITPLHMQAFRAGKTPSQIVSTQIGSDVYQQSTNLSGKPVQGLRYQYYESEFRRTTTIVESPVIEEGVTPTLSLEKSRQVNNFAFLYDGYILIPKDGLYTLYLESNDGSVLFLDDYLLIDNDGQHGTNEEQTSISLREGMHKIAVRYFQAGGGSTFHVSWKGPEIAKQEIQAAFLYHVPSDD
jgi:hypothetical protein